MTVGVRFPLSQDIKCTAILYLTIFDVSKLCGLWDSFIKHAYKQLHLLKQVYFTIHLDWLTTTLKYVKLSYACIRFPNRYLIQLFVVPYYDPSMRKGNTSFSSHCSRQVNKTRIDFFNLVVYCGMFKNISFILMKKILGYSSVFFFIENGDNHIYLILV